jgi:hypothetical protein
MDALDAIDGLKALEQVVETISEELHDLYQSRDIPQIERVTLHSLEWTLAKLNGDLHTMETEVKDLRLSMAAARTLDLQRLGDMSRIAKERDELRWQLAQVTAERDSLKDKLETVENLHDAACQQEAELSGNPGELPAEPAPETYQWQVGDELRHNTSQACHPIAEARDGWIRLSGSDEWKSQSAYQRSGWKLYSKASDRLGVQQLTPRQVEISDGTQADGEGQSK